MDFFTGNIRRMYFRYLAAAFGSSLISCIYGLVDTAMVGQYHGPEGSAALAVVAPVWNIIYSLGLWMGIGGSVLFSTIRGREDEEDDKANQYFTAAVIGSVVLAAITWFLVVVFDRQLLTLFGAEENTLTLARRYIFPVKFAVPFFLINQLLAAFLRNDKEPGLATAGVLAGGLFNIFGDWFFIFACDMGATGAGLATSIGAVIRYHELMSHIFAKKNTLRLLKPDHLLEKLKRISVTGFSTFFVDAAMGIVTILFNRQIMSYLGTNALSVYAVVVNISTFVQCCSYSVGQAAQPIISMNYGAGKGDRIRQTLKYALGTVALFSIAWTALSLAVPNGFIRVFMTPTATILEIAPAIIRTYGISFLLLPLNIFSTYYFQAIMKPGTAFITSVARGAVISGVLLYLLPAVAGGSAIWLTMPITEFLVAVYVVIMMGKCTKQLPMQENAAQ